MPSLTYYAQQQGQRLNSQLQDLKAQDRWHHDDVYCAGLMNNQSVSLAMSMSQPFFRLVALLCVTLGLLPSLGNLLHKPECRRRGPGQPRLTFRSWEPT
jgi:hypothetical protein